MTEQQEATSRSTEYAQGKVWQYLYEHGPHTPRELGKALGILSPGTICRRLVEKGYATAIGKTVQLKYSAKGHKRPESLRGKHPNVLKNFTRGKKAGKVVHTEAPVPVPPQQPGRLYVPDPVHPLDIAMRKKR